MTAPRPLQTVGVKGYDGFAIAIVEDRRGPAQLPASARLSIRHHDGARLVG